MSDHNISFFEDRPTLDELDFKIDILTKFKNINIELLPNLLFYGYNACGKTTQIYAFLASLLDKKVYDLKNNVYEEDRKTLNYKSSIYHIEINATGLGSNEKIFIQSLLKSYVETRNIGLGIPKIVLIKNANNLSSQAQLALRRIIEKNYYTTKFIFEVSSISNFLEPIISRCLLIRISVPNIDAVRTCLKRISEKDNIIISDDQINLIITESNKVDLYINLKKIFGFYRYFITTNNNFKFFYYDKFNEILKFIITKKFLYSSLLKIREIINEMYINTVCMAELLMFLYNKLMIIYKDDTYIMNNIIKITTECDLLLKKGNKECIHLELYVVSIIDLLQNI
jgi:hypothetical protein